MMSSQANVSEPAPRPGILDHLSDGMSLVIALPFLALIPIVLDALLWLMPSVSGRSISGWASSKAQVSSSTVLDQFGSWLGRQGDWDIARGLVFLQPTVLDGASPEKTYAALTLDPLSLNTIAAGTAVAMSVALGALIFIGFETWLAISAKLVDLDRSQVVPTILRSWGRLLLFGFIIAGALAVAAMAMILPSVLTGTTIVGGDATLGFLSLVGLILLIATMFVPEAIVLDSAGPIQALRSSLRVVSAHFWQSLGFFLVSILISPGLLSIWERITFHPVGLLIAIILNAGMVTSLALASLGFYQARSRTAS